MNECPKCNRKMIALFAIPKCEVCELGGVDVPRYWVTGQMTALNQFKETRVTVFDTKKHAELWGRHLRDEQKLDFQVFQVQVAACNTASFLWETVGPGHKVIPGCKYFAGYAFTEEQYAEKTSSIVPKLVVVK